MRFVILVSAIVLLVIAADINAHEFGDIIYYEPVAAAAQCQAFAGRHVAVYVGNHEFKGKEQDDDIFHRVISRDNPKVSVCIFSSLKDIKKKTGACNYLDGYVGYDKHKYVKGSVAEMTTRINNFINDCGTYDQKNNNCEHLATFVRYGVKISLQEGLIGELYCKTEKEWDRIPMLIYVREQKRKGNLKCELRAAQ